MDCCLITCLVIFIFSQFQLISTQSANLSVTYSSVKLPPYKYLRAWYDGQDEVYLLGSGVSNRILTYSLSSDKIQTKGSLPLDAGSATLQSDSDGNIFYFGADGGADKIQVYLPSANSSAVVTQLSDNKWDSPTLKLDAGTVLILGGRSHYYDILSFDMASRKVTLLDKKLPRSFCFAINFKKKAYLFPDWNGPIWELELETLSFKRMVTPEFLHFNRKPSPMTDGSRIFVLATSKTVNGFKKEAGFYEFVPGSTISTFRPVRNWPLKDGHMLYDAQAVYVPKLKRIYGFGLIFWDKNAKEFEHHDDIFWIDLGTGLDEKQGQTEAETQASFDFEHEFVCTPLTQDDWSRCILFKNQSTEFEGFCEIRYSQNVSCRDLSSDSSEDGPVKNITRSLGNDCSFEINLVSDDVTLVLYCGLSNGGRLVLNFVPGDDESPLLQYLVIVLFSVLGIFVIGFFIRRYNTKKNAEVNHAVFWNAVLN